MGQFRPLLASFSSFLNCNCSKIVQCCCWRELSAVSSRQRIGKRKIRKWRPFPKLYCCEFLRCCFVYELKIIALGTQIIPEKVNVTHIICTVEMLWYLWKTCVYAVVDYAVMMLAKSTTTQAWRLLSKHEWQILNASQQILKEQLAEIKYGYVEISSTHSWALVR